MTAKVVTLTVVAACFAVYTMNSGYSRKESDEVSIGLLAQQIESCLEAIDSYSICEPNSAESDLLKEKAIQFSERALSLAEELQVMKPGPVSSLHLAMSHYCELRILKEVKEDMPASHTKKAKIHQLLFLAEGHAELTATEEVKVLDHQFDNAKLDGYRRAALAGSANSAREVAWHLREEGDYMASYGWHYLWFLLQMRTNDKPNMVMASDGLDGMRELSMMFGAGSWRELRNIEKGVFDVFMKMMIEGKNAK